MPSVAEAARAEAGNFPLSLFRLSVVQYRKMIAKGIIPEDDRIELLFGLLVNKMPHNPPHDGAISILQAHLASLLGMGWFIRIQFALVVGKNSQPEPDLAIVHGPIKRYLKQHPASKEVGLVIEVADSSLATDRSSKGALYAGGRIPRYWIINIPEQQVEAYTEPKAGSAARYRSRVDYGLGEQVPVVLQDRTLGYLAVSDLFPEASD
jgi:Uma2 family endonuclease